MRPDYGLPQPVVGWIYNHSRKNYWRLAAWYEVEDLIQDGLMIAYKARERYGSDLDPPHYMRLVQSMFRNHIGDLLRRMRGFDDRTKLADLAGGGTEERAIDQLAEPTEHEGDFSRLVAELPVALRKAVHFYLKGDVAKLRRSLRVRLDKPDETEGERFERLTGFPQRKDFETELRAYLWKNNAGLV